MKIENADIRFELEEKLFEYLKKLCNNVTDLVIEKNEKEIERLEIDNYTYRSKLESIINELELWDHKIYIKDIEEQK